MVKIEITFEKTVRVCKEYEVSEETLEWIKNGEMPFWDEATRELDANEGNLEYDYAVNDDNGNTIVDWE